MSNFRDMLTTAFKAGWVVGLFCGIFEALLISGQVLFQNSWSLSLFAGVIKLISLNAALFIAFAVLVGLCAGVVLSFLMSDREAFKLWLLRAVWFAGLMLLFGIWLNYKSSRPLLSAPSLIYNLGSSLGALALAEIAGRMSRAKLAAIQPARKGGQRTFSLVWLGLLLLAFVPDLKSDVATPSGQRKPNVVLLIVDTLRADHLGCYGYERDTSPNIDAVAENGVRFDQAYVQWASSLPSHSSILTSLYPHIHGAFPNGKSLNPEIITLSKILKAHGYKNGAFVSNVLVGNQYNFDRNYDTFTDLTDFDYRETGVGMWLHSLNLMRLVDWAKDTDLFTELAVKWIAHHKDEPFYLWAQWLYPHAPYEPPAKFLKKFESSYSGIANGTLAQINKINDEELKLDEAGQEHYRALYDAEVAKSDYEVGRVIDRLRALNLLENTLLVITSDHGENLYEHRMEYGHYGVYDSSIRIPLIFYFPEKLPAGAAVPQVVESIDIVPTILDLLELEIPEQFQGKSTVPLIEEGNVEGWKNSAFSMMFREERNFMALRRDEYKIILDARTHHIEYELYHIPTDPDERNNLYAEEPTIADSLKGKLLALIEQEFDDPALVLKPGNILQKDFDKKTIEHLRSLGYIK